MSDDVVPTVRRASITFRSPEFTERQCSAGGLYVTVSALCRITEPNSRHSVIE